MKLFRRLALAVLLLLIVGGVILFMSLNRIVKRTVESQATDSLNLDTKVGGARLALFGGTLNLSDLEIASPQGFTAPHMLTLGDAGVGVSMGQLRSDPVHVSDVTLKKPKLVVEQVGGKLNFKSAMDLLPKSPEQKQSKSEPMKVIIDNLTVQDAAVVFKSDLPGVPPELTVPVPSVTLKNVGTGDGNQNGAAIKDVVMQVVTAMAASAANSDLIPEQLKALLHLNIGQVMSQFGAEAQKRIAAAVPGELGKTLSEALKDPSALMKDPSKLLGGNLKDKLPASVKDNLGGLLGNKTAGDAGSTTNPSTQPDNSPAKAVQDQINGLFGKKKK